MSPHVMQQILVWSREMADSYRFPLAVLAALAACAWPIRRAVNAGRLGHTASLQGLPPGAAWIIVWVPIWFWLFSVWLAQTHEVSFLRMVDEDGWMEYGQAVVLGVGSALSGLIARSLWRGRQRFWALGYLLLAVALFWVTGEEISWGQRLLQVPTPAWFVSHNTQEELNFHNLTGVDGTLSNLTDYAIAWSVCAALAGWATGLHQVRRLRAALWLPHPSLVPALCCVLSYGEILRFYELSYPGVPVSAAITQLQEPRETVLYFSIIMFLWLVRDRSQLGRARAAQAQGRLGDAR